MTSSDDEAQAIPSSVATYEFVDDKNEPKMYKQVNNFSRIEPAISVLSKESNWIKLEKPRKFFQDTIRSILITVHSLHLLKRNPKSSGRAFWVFRNLEILPMYEPRPSENDLVDHMNLLSKKIFDKLTMKKRKKKMTNYNHFESLCPICDDGGELLWSFHTTVDDDAQSQCETLGYTKAQVRNCEYQQHQCYACGELGSSDQSSHAEKIAAGESFACPLHHCCVCKQREDNDIPELQFAMCRRCPTSYHRKCLPKAIVFDKSKVEEENNEDDYDDDDVMPRAWDGLIKKLNFDLLFAVKVDSSRKRERLSLPDSSKRQKIVDAARKSFDKTSSEKLNKAIKSEGKTSLGDKVYALISRESQPGESGEEGKTKIVKSDKKEPSSSQTLDATSKSRILCMMKDVKSSITMEKIVQKVPKTHTYSSKFDKSITSGKVEGSFEAIRAALQILDGGGKVEDAKAVCEPGLLAHIMKWRGKLRVYLAPFIHGMRYTSFGRHFTKVKKLREIVDMLHWYVRDGDMIVDLCCGSNNFSCLMKKKLDEIGKGCSYKNYDLFQPKNDFNFEKRDWMTVLAEGLPVGSKLIMGLNPPFGVNAALANKFINKALEFKPKLLILIVPKETERDFASLLFGSPYDLVWEDDALLGGKANCFSPF
ncbi:unnamed protein product [Withania somnifera]